MKLMFYFQNKEVDINKTITVYFVWIVILSFTARVIYLNNNTKNYPVVDENSSYGSSEENGYVQEEAPAEEFPAEAVEEAPALPADSADSSYIYTQRSVNLVYSDKLFKVINENANTYSDFELNSNISKSLNTNTTYFSNTQTDISVKLYNGSYFWVNKNDVIEISEQKESNSKTQSDDYRDILYQLESNFGKSVDYSNLFADNVLAFIMLKNIKPQKIKYIFETEKEYLNQSIYEFGTLTYKSDKDGYKHYVLPAKLKCYRQSLKQTETSDVDILLAFDENNKIVKFVFMNKRNVVRE